MSITATFLQDIEHGGPANQAEQTAAQFADFIHAAQSSLHLAIYDFRLDPAQPAHRLIVNALKERAAAGVDCRVAYDHGKGTASQVGIDPAPTGTAAFLTGVFGATQVRCKSITDRNPMHPEPRLMHNKYMIRDGATPGASVWTGSVNITDDSLNLQESNIVQLASPELARYYETDFSELWASGDIESSGANDLGTVVIDGCQVQVAFSPGEGELISNEVGSLIARARRRLKIGSMLIASRTILETLWRVRETNQVAEFTGIYDATQMEQTIENWRMVPHNNDLIPLFQEVVQGLAAKHSEPYTPTSRHNFMHNKMLVVDDAVFTGSYNLSHSAAQNAENALIIHDPALAEQYSEYIDRLVAQYGQ